MVCAVIALALLIRAGPRRVPGIVLFGMALGCLVELVFLTIEFTGSNILDVGRFEAPSTLACALFAGGLLWPVQRATATAARTSGDAVPDAAVRPGGSSVGQRRLRRRVLGALATVVVGALLWDVTFGDTFSYKARLISREAARGARVIAGTAQVISPYPPADHRAYAALNALIPKGAKVLAAVNQPGLLDMSKFTVATLDQPGAASPPPHMPLFFGPNPLVKYLRRLGYQYVAVDSPTTFGIYNQAQWEASKKDPVWTKHEYGRYYLQWLQDVSALESGAYPTQHARWLRLIDIRPGAQPG